MLTLNLCKPVKLLDGADTDALMADTLANWLCMSTDEDYKKWMDIARELLSTKKVEMQRRDLVDLETKIKKSDIKNLFKEQLLDEINETLNQKEGE